MPVDQNNPDPGLDMERASDAFIKVPLILGVSSTESNLDFNANDIQYGFEEDHRNRILRTFIRNAYVYHLNEIFSAVRNEYTDWDKPVLHPIIIRDSTMEALSDGHTVAPLMRIAFYHARRGAKTYFYHFDYQTKDSGHLKVRFVIRSSSFISVISFFFLYSTFLLFQRIGLKRKICFVSFFFEYFAPTNITCKSFLFIQRRNNSWKK